MAEESPPERIEFHYIKGSAFRVVHADGVWGGPTSRGYITMAFYSERSPIPQSLVHEVTEGKLGPEVERVTKKGVVREVDVEVMIDLDLAKSFQRWLTEKIEALEQLQSQKQERK